MLWNFSLKHPILIPQWSFTAFTCVKHKHKVSVVGHYECTLIGLRNIWILKTLTEVLAQVTWPDSYLTIRQCCLWGCCGMHMTDASQRWIAVVQLSVIKFHVSCRMLFACVCACMLHACFPSGTVGLTRRELTESAPRGCSWDLASSHPKVRRCWVFVISAKHAGTGFPGCTAVSLLYRWSLLCHHPNKASYWPSWE